MNEYFFAILVFNKLNNIPGLYVIKKFCNRISCFHRYDILKF